MTEIEYRHDCPLDPTEVARVFDASGITRPTTDLPRIARMFAAPSLVISAWQNGRLVGVSRSLTDYSYCCYLSDLAVDSGGPGFLDRIFPLLSGLLRFRLPAGWAAN